VFQADLKTGQSGIFTGNGGPAALIADTSTRFSSLGGAPAINDSGQVAFNANLKAGGSGVFKATTASIDTMADTRGPFSGFGVSSINNAGTVAFRADLKAGGQGIFTGDGLTLTTIAGTSGPFKSFEDVASINNEGTVAFLADFKAGGKGIFTETDLITDEVIATGDALFGSTVTNLSFVRDGLNDAGQLAFWATVADGRAFIVRADAAPEPSTVLLLGIGIVGLIGYAWRRYSPTFRRYPATGCQKRASGFFSSQDHCPSPAMPMQFHSKMSRV
jgi:hypothetical protein